VSAAAIDQRPIRAPRRRGRRLALALVSRVAEALVVAFGVLTITFLLIHLIPGDPARQILGTQAPPKVVAALREQLHLNEPLPAQYAKFMAGVAHGDLGDSLAQSNRSVIGLIGDGFGITFVLIAATMTFSAIVGVALGLWAGTTGSKSLDGGIRLTSMIGLGTPPFFLGAVLILLVSLKLGLAPAGGAGHGYPDRLRYLWLPALTLSGLLIPLIARAVRERARAVMREQFVEAALARGISPRRLLLSHVLPNSVLPAITLIGIQSGVLLASAVVVETLFGIPGLGTVLLTAVQGRDYPVVQGVVVFAGLFVVACNLLADVAVGLIDPRGRR
jgi:peptide/nickel transport system permease protein